MSNRIWRGRGALWLSLGAAVFLIATLWLPLWQMRMEAPQYRDEEALRVVVYPNALRGDLNEIKVLNQYIGVHVPEELPQFKWLPAAFVACAVLGIGAALLPRDKRRYGLIIVPLLLALALLGAAAQAQWQMHEIGHRRDAKTIMVGVKDFDAPFIGSRKIAQFQIASRLGIGAYLAGLAMALQWAGAWMSRPVRGGGMRQEKAAGPGAAASHRGVSGPAIESMRTLQGSTCCN